MSGTRKYPNYAAGMFRHHKYYGPFSTNKNIYVEGMMNFRNNMQHSFNGTGVKNMLTGTVLFVAFPSLIWSISLQGNANQDRLAGNHHDYALSSRNSQGPQTSLGHVRNADFSPVIGDPTERRAKIAERKAEEAKVAIEKFRAFAATSEVTHFNKAWERHIKNAPADQIDAMRAEIIRLPTPEGRAVYSMQKARVDRAIMDAHLAAWPMIKQHDLRIQDEDLPDWWGDKEKRDLFEDFWTQFVNDQYIDKYRNRGANKSLMTDKKYDFVRASLDEKLPGWKNYPNLRLGNPMYPIDQILGRDHTTGVSVQSADGAAAKLASPPPTL